MAEGLLSRLCQRHHITEIKVLLVKKTILAPYVATLYGMETDHEIFHWKKLEWNED